MIDTKFHDHNISHVTFFYEIFVEFIRLNNRQRDTYR